MSLSTHITRVAFFVCPLATRIALSDSIPSNTLSQRLIKSLSFTVWLAQGAFSIWIQVELDSVLAQVVRVALEIVKLLNVHSLLLHRPVKKGPAERDCALEDEAVDEQGADEPETRVVRSVAPEVHTDRVSVLVEVQQKLGESF